jgi:hypothetical protein
LACESFSDFTIRVAPGRFLVARRDHDCFGRLAGILLLPGETRFVVFPSIIAGDLRQYRSMLPLFCEKREA